MKALAGKTSRPPSIEDGPAECAEETYLYDGGYATDVAILEMREDITRLQDGSKSVEAWGKKRLKAAKRASELLVARYRALESTMPLPVEDTSYATPNAADPRVMLHAVLRNWKQRYLYPRMEVASYTDYQDYADAALSCGMKRPPRLEPGEPVHRALRNIHLGPTLLAGEAVSIIVPPNVDITGNRGNCRIYDWGALAVDNTLQLC